MRPVSPWLKRRSGVPRPLGAGQRRILSLLVETDCSVEKLREKLSKAHATSTDGPKLVSRIATLVSLGLVSALPGKKLRLTTEGHQALALLVQGPTASRGAARPK
jgi:hypothetical protein